MGTAVPRDLAFGLSMGIRNRRLAVSGPLGGGGGRSAAL